MFVPESEIMTNLITSNTTQTGSAQINRIDVELLGNKDGRG